MQSNRIHLLAHANPIGPDIKRFGFAHVKEYVAFVRAHLPRPLCVTCNTTLLNVVEDPWHGGRHDDAARIRDLQRALDDPRTLAIVALTGGAYFSRILPHVSLRSLARRRHPLWALGFSEMSPLVNLVARYRCGRGLYWLCPHWLAWSIRPPETARAALAEFWQVLPDVLAGRQPPSPRHLSFGPLEGKLAAGRVRNGHIRLVGGCLAVLAAVVGGQIGRRIRPAGHWLLLEDIKESPYRIDRHLAALKHAGWFERAAGLLIGDFHMMHQDTQPAVLDLLRYHLPARSSLPVVATNCVGHVWPMVPVALNHTLELRLRGRRVTVHGMGLSDPNCRGASR